jgi:predicted Rossmann fold flavoprotein
MTSQNSYDVMVLGAGAAGLMCASVAGQRGRSALLLEQARQPGEKIRISGGGRCNFTNLHTSPANFLSDNPRFCNSALSSYTQRDFMALVDSYGIAHHEKTRGQLFCDGSSRQIVDMLLTECRKARAQLRLGIKISAVAKGESGFIVVTDQGEFRGRSLVVATGGPSIPKMGSSGFGYKIAEQFDMKIVPPRPALVPLTFDDKLLTQFADLSGVSVDAVVSCGKTRFDEALLFTHRGLSGPAILQISSYWREGHDIVVDMAPPIDVLATLKQLRSVRPRQEMATALVDVLPKRLARKIADATAGPERIADFSDKLLAKVAADVKQWRVKPNGTEGYRTAEVTLGGVDTSGLSSKTFEAKSVPGLYFIGEVVDVTGHLGGFNFQWAWSSGYAAGRHL